MQTRMWTKRKRLILGLLVLAPAWGCTSNAPVQRELVIAPAPVACDGAPAATCLNVSEPTGDQWVMRFDEITGFDYEPGFTYQVLVEEPPVNEELAIVPRLSLVRVISKEPAGDAPTSALGRSEWLLQQITPSQQDAAAWQGGRITATLRPDAGWAEGFSGCNTYIAALSVDGQSITISPPATTMELCGGATQDLERTYLAALAKAKTFALTGDVLELTTVDGTRLQFRAEG